jgi:preprotein translocase subunit SecA
MLMRAQVQFEEPVQMTPAGAFALPDFITHHIDPLSGDDDTGDLDAGGPLLTNLPPLQAPKPPMPEEADGETIVAPASRNAPCPCGSGQKYKHCHGQAA